MADILDELLALARDGADARDTDAVPLEVVAASAWASVATGDATLNIDADGESVDAVRGRLQQLLENLFANAVEHGSTSPDSQTHEDAVEHGSTSPDSQTRRDAADAVATDAAGAAADGGESLTVDVGLLAGDEGFYVADDGPGIPEEEREDVFEMGYTTSDDGTGFGLAIVDRVADAHGWDVAVTDSESGGARFEFRTAD